MEGDWCVLSQLGLDLFNSWAFLSLVWPPSPPLSLRRSNLLRLESLLSTETGLKGRSKFCSQRGSSCTGKVHLNWGEEEPGSPEPLPGAALRGGRLRRGCDNSEKARGNDFHNHLESLEGVCSGEKKSPGPLN